MSAPAPHPDCCTCEWWEYRIREARARALRGCVGAYSDEKRVRQELSDHLERSHGEGQ